MSKEVIVTRPEDRAMIRTLRRKQPSSGRLEIYLQATTRLTTAVHVRGLPSGAVLLEMLDEILCRTR